MVFAFFVVLYIFYEGNTAFLSVLTNRKAPLNGARQNIITRELRNTPRSRRDPALTARQDGRWIQTSVPGGENGKG